ncbi:ferredoxin--NADP reductase [Saccharicrinis fermentans]|uniref:Anthranilate 1,2-dioxygenase electron transfer component n=1 Tax=Saccharicrinis fermentans DSM 9555 = JCM 21142 TaxID=869213 RepID=W7Y2U0_9BACT|nr:FAD-binding oxidoreductase [Saccharicrinis fermentans]GAF05140.1 anthranilate 1,2-dioxygenase electron transfer component [Saccharicrinis fermentans DSM 9555 = JCM 21142]
MTRKRKELFPHTITSVNEITPGYFTVAFKRQFDFIPGQVVAVSFNNQDDPRLYSIAGGNQNDTMRILFDVYPNGLLTPLLSTAQVGDEILVSEPFGKFTPSTSEEWWIATGTGIAPFVSMLESGIKSPQKFLHGSRTLNHFLFQDLFKEKLKDNYLRFCTKETGPEIIQGRLTHWLKEQDELPKNFKYYLCGNPDMVVEVRDIILSKGVEFENIMAEIYF